MSKPALVLLPLAVLLLLSPPLSAEPGMTEPDPEPGPAVQVIPPFTEQPPAEFETYAVFHVIENCVVTYYDVCVLCCGKADGITASGAAAVPYETCAVDPEVIPLGSVVKVAYDDGEVRTCRAEDTGSGVKGNHIDVCVAGHEEAKALGVRQATVYWEEARA